jgi:hypothetical protein
MNNSRSLTKNENDLACNIGPPLFPNTSYDTENEKVRRRKGKERRKG